MSTLPDSPGAAAEDGDAWAVGSFAIKDLTYWRARRRAYTATAASPDELQVMMDAYDENGAAPDWGIRR